MSRTTGSKTTDDVAQSSKSTGKAVIKLPRKALFRVPYPVVIKRSPNGQVDKPLLVVPTSRLVRNATSQRLPTPPPTTTNNDLPVNVGTDAPAILENFESLYADEFTPINYEGQEPDALDILLNLNEPSAIYNVRNTIECPICHKYGPRNRIDNHYISYSGYCKMPPPRCKKYPKYK